MDRKYIDDNSIGIKYLRGTLDNEELEQFEIYMLENPEIIDELELDEAFLTHLREDESASPQISESQERLNAWKMKSVFSGTLLFAAGLLSGSFFMNFIDNDVYTVDLVYLDKTRSGSENPSQIPKVGESNNGRSLFNENMVVISVDAGLDQKLNYKGKISNVSAPEVSSEFTISKSEIGRYGSVNVTLNLNKYSPGQYELRIIDQSNEVASSTFLFEIVSEAE